MNRYALYAVVFFGTILLTGLLTPAIAAVARRWNIVDRPDRLRKQHRHPVPLLGGTAIWLSVAAVIAFLGRLGMLPDDRLSWRAIFGFLLGSALLMVTGYLDDRYRLPPRYLIIGPSLAALAVIASGVRITLVTNPFGGIVLVPFGLSVLVSFVWVLGMMFTTKFLDGLDGLVASLTAIGALVIFGISLSWDQPSASTAVLALGLAGSCIGFLALNRSPAQVFLGEGGSLLTGYVLAFLAIVSGSKIATALLVMGVPILDVGWVIVERIRNRTLPSRGDRRHLHFRLVDRGMAPRRVVILLSGISAGFGLVALVASSFGKMLSLGALVVVVVVLLQWAQRTPRGDHTRFRVGRLRLWMIFGGMCLALGVGILSASRPAQAPTNTAVVTLAGVVVRAEVARTVAEQARGLSDRQALAEGRGMLFPLPYPQRPVFWMRNMRFPIDIIWINNGRVIAITANAPPPKEEQFPVQFQPHDFVTMVLEVPAGFSQRHNIQVNDPVKINYP